MTDNRRRILALREILARETDDEHTLTADALVARLAAFGVQTEKKTIYRDIAALREDGMDIISAGGRGSGFMLGAREFELAEVRLLMDAVQASSFITPKKTAELLAKLRALVSRYQAESLDAQVHIDSAKKDTNEEIYYNIDVLHAAIAKGLKVSLLYFRQKPPPEQPQGREFILSPYALIWSGDVYYLVCNYEKYGDLMHLRLDRIRRVEMLEASVRPMEEVSPYTGRFDANDYARKSFKMFTGNLCEVRLLCRSEIALEQILDHVGRERVPVLRDDGHYELSASVMLSQGLVSWLLQFGCDVEVESPQSLRDDMKAAVEKMGNIY